MSTAGPLEILQQAAGLKQGPDMEDLLEIYIKNFYYNVFYLTILTIIQLIVLFNVVLGGSFADVIQNWPKYRCNPAIMPFAALFGYDATENFNFCMKTIFNTNAAAVLGPVYGVMSKFTDIAGTIANSANSFRYLIANLLNGMERLMASYRDRFQFLLFTIRMSYMKMTTLMGRLYGTFYALIFMGLSGIKAADNVANNDLVKFLLEFCFDPQTPIEMADGSVKKLIELEIGDILKSVDGTNPVVTSLFRFDGSNTPMVKIGQTHVSREHFVYYENNWIKAGDHPDAVVAESIPELVCLNTNTHVLYINGLTFADYDESDDATVVETTQALAEMRLNSGVFDTKENKTGNYDLGLDKDTPIVYKDGSLRVISEVKIGDELLGGGVVLGLVRESCRMVTTLPNGRIVSSAQLLWDKDFSLWRRASFVYNTVTLETPVTLYQLTVTNNIVESVDYIFRDYREINDPDMESAYEQEFSKKLKTGTKNIII